MRLKVRKDLVVLKIWYEYYLEIQSSIYLFKDCTNEIVDFSTLPSNIYNLFCMIYYYSVEYTALIFYFFIMSMKASFMPGRSLYFTSSPKMTSSVLA